MSVSQVFSFDEVYQIFAHAEDYINYLIAGMVVLSCYWYLISRRRRVLAKFVRDGKTKRVYKLENTITNKGFADIKLKGSLDKRTKGFLNAVFSDGAARGWRLWVKDGDSAIDLDDGKSYEVFGRSYVFQSCLGTHKAYRGHFISIILMTACSLMVQLYLGVYACFQYGYIDPNYGLPLASLLRVSHDMAYWISFLGLWSLEALILVIVSIVNARRITPEVVLFFFLSYMGFLLVPHLSILISLIAGWCVWCAAPPFLAKLFSWMDSRSLFIHGSVHIPALSLIIAVSIILFAVSVYLGHSNAPGTLPVQQLKVFSAAGGIHGLGLYNGRFRIESPQSLSIFIIGVLFEEMGLRTGFLFILIILLIAYGCYFQGLRAEKYYSAVLCFLTAVFIGLCVLFNLFFTTGAAINLMGIRLDISVPGLSMPFLSGDMAPLIILFLCLALVESVKLSGRIKAAPAAVTLRAEAQDENSEDNRNNEPVLVNTDESGRGE